MKISVVLGTLCVASASQILSSIQTRIHTKSRQISNLKQITIKEEELAGPLAQDVKSHNRVKGVRAVQLMPEPGNCGLHWDLCPNMCNLNETLMNNFAEIVGNKMTKYQEWKQDTAEKKRAIIKDLEGKLDQVSGLEDLLKKNGLDLEKREELFIALLEDHIAQSLALKERLAIINSDFGEIEIELTSLSGKIDAAHTDCYEQAPCMAVPQCKLGVASGQSCQDIAQKAMDTDEQGDPTLNKENGVYIIQPEGLDAKAAICEFDYTGTGYTVVQNRYNDTGSFSGDFENGFGTTIGYDDATCAEANYFLGNKYIRKLAEGASHLKVKTSGGVDQWDNFSVRGNKLNLNGAKHVCGDDTTDGSQVKLGAGGLNGRWTGQTRVMIGRDTDPSQDPDCMDLGPEVYGGDTYGGGAYGGDYDAKDSSSYY